MNENENLSLYEQLRNVPQEAQTPFNNGTFKGTDINPMWRIKRLTEMFGACGFGWYFKVVKREVLNGCVFIAIELYVKINDEWSAPIYGEGGNRLEKTNAKGVVRFEDNTPKYNDECFKMALTDAIGNASKYLGLGADIWWTNDFTKYTAPIEENPQKPQSQPQTPDYKSMLLNAKTLDELKNIWSKIPNKSEFEDLKNNIKNSLTK